MKYGKSEGDKLLQRLLFYSGRKVLPGDFGLHLIGQNFVSLPLLAEREFGNCVLACFPASVV